MGQVHLRTCRIKSGLITKGHKTMDLNSDLIVSWKPKQGPYKYSMDWVLQVNACPLSSIVHPLGLKGWAQPQSHIYISLTLIPSHTFRYWSPLDLNQSRGHITVDPKCKDSCLSAIRINNIIFQDRSFKQSDKWTLNSHP